MNVFLRHALWLPLAVTACKSGDDGGGDDTDAVDTDDVDATAIDLEGTWQTTDGDVFADRGLGDVGFVTFERVSGHDAGFLRLYAEEPDSHALNCPQEIWGVAASGTLTVSADGGEGGGGPDLFLVDQPDADTLVITDVYGVAQTLTRVDAVAPDSVCGSVEVTADTTFDVASDYWSNLLWDGAHLSVGLDAGGVATLNLATAEVGTPVDFGYSYEHLQVFQGDDGWGHCACGGSTEIARTSPGGTQVDLIEFEPDLGIEMGVRGAAWDGTHLWVSGYGRDDAHGHVLEVDSEAEPDVLVADHVTPLASQPLVFHDGALYVLTGQRVVRLDADALADATWQLPPELSSENWNGITSDGTSLFLGAQTDSGQTYRVVKVTLK
jgi:hypothetical protein